MNKGKANSFASRRLRICAVSAALSVCFGANGHAGKVAYFGVTNGQPGQEFVIALSDPKKIAQARAILAGKETKNIHVEGTAVVMSQSYNRPGPVSDVWDFYVDPASITFFQLGPESCNKSTFFVAEHARASDLMQVLPPPKAGNLMMALLMGHWCPQDSRIVAELQDSDLVKSGKGVTPKDHGLPWPWGVKTAP